MSPVPFNILKIGTGLFKDGSFIPKVDVKLTLLIPCNTSSSMLADIVLLGIYCFYNTCRQK